MDGSPKLFIVSLLQSLLEISRGRQHTGITAQTSDVSIAGEFSLEAVRADGVAR